MRQCDTLMNVGLGRSRSEIRQISNGDFDIPVVARSGWSMTYGWSHGEGVAAKTFAFDRLGRIAGGPGACAVSRKRTRRRRGAFDNRGWRAVVQGFRSGGSAAPVCAQRIIARRRDDATQGMSNAPQRLAEALGISS